MTESLIRHHCHGLNSILAVSDKSLIGQLSESQATYLYNPLPLASIVPRIVVASYLDHIWPNSDIPAGIQLDCCPHSRV